MNWFNEPTPAVLLAGNRTGGTLLTTALSSHPNIFCARGEPFHHENPWRNVIPNERRRLHLLWSQRGFDVSMFKLNFPDLTPKRRQLLQDKENLRAIFLTRDNVIAEAVSNEINVLYRAGKLKGHPTQAYNEGKLELSEVTLDLGDVQSRYKEMLKNNRRTQRFLKQNKIPTLSLTYERLTGSENISTIPQEVSEEICKFLGVPHRGLIVLLKKVHRQPYSEFVTNWKEINELLER